MAARPPGAGPGPPGAAGQLPAQQPQQSPPGSQPLERNGSGGGMPSQSPDPDGITLIPVAEFVEQLREAGQHAKPYQILGPLGKGKFAMVYKAALGDQLYALKKVALTEMLSESSRIKCLKEVQLLRGLIHPNIVRYEDSYIDAATGELVIVLQWARGGDLKKLIKKVKSGQAKIAEFSEGMIWKYCRELASGLSYMHEKRVMHRDLKAANIMLSHDNHIMLGDLGLSRYFNPQTMEAFSKVGTPLNIAPEVLVGTGYGFAADSWSLGTILYELCTLTSPFKPTTEGVNLFALFAAIRSGKFDPIPPEAKYSENLRALINALLRVDPNQRPTMHQVRDIAERMVEQRIARQLQAKEEAGKQQQQQQQQATPPTAVGSPSTTAPTAATVASSPAASASPTAVSPSAAAAGAPFGHAERPPALAMPPAGAHEAPLPLTPPRRRAGSASREPRPLNASPLPSPSSAAMNAAAAAKAAEELGQAPMRSLSPISPILSRAGSERGPSDAAALNAAHTVAASPTAVSSLEASPPPSLVSRPPSAVVRPSSASGRPISASHRPPSSSQQQQRVPVLRPSSKESARTPSQQQQQQQQPSVPPLNISDPRPTSSSAAVRPGSRGSSGGGGGDGAFASPEGNFRSIFQSPIGAVARAGAGGGSGRGSLDHFPLGPSGHELARAELNRNASGNTSTSSNSSAGRPDSRPSGGFDRTTSLSPVLGPLSDSRDGDEEEDGSGASGSGDGRQSPMRRPNPLANPGAQSFLYDRASPSPSPKVATRGLATLANLGEDFPKHAHMSFASSPPVEDVDSPLQPSPPVIRSPPLQPRVSSASGRPSSRGSLGSASGSRPTQPVVALKLAAKSPLSDEDLSPLTTGSSQQQVIPSENAVMSPPATVARTRSLKRANSTNNNTGSSGVVPSLTPASMAAATAAAADPLARQESFRNPRIKSASAVGNGVSKQQPQSRVPLSQFDEVPGEEDAADTDTRGLSLPPRPMSVDAPQRPSAPLTPALAASLPFPSAEAMMEDLVESCKLLHYESRLCSRANLPWLTHDFFVHDFHSLRQAQVIAAKQGKPGGGMVAARVAAIAEAEGLPSRVAVSLSASPPCPAPTPSQQLLYFGWLVLWLLSFLQRGGSKSGDPLEHAALVPLHDELRSWRPYADYRDADEGESDDRRASLADTILAQLAQARLPPCPTPLSVAVLCRNPSGLALLQPLYRLSQAVYFAKLHGSVVLSPLAMRHYPVFEPNPAYAGEGQPEDEDEVEEEVEEEDGVAAMGEPQDDAEDATAADEDLAFPAPAATAVPASALSDEALWAAREAAAREWLAEFSRLAESGALTFNAGRIPAAGQREWKQHQELAAKHAEALLQSPLLTAPASGGGNALGPSSLPNRAAELRRLLERISLFERRLHSESGLASSREAFIRTRDRLDELEAEHAALSARVAEDAAALAHADEQLAAKQEELRYRKDSTDDEHGLRTLRRTIGSMRQEIKRFDVLLGIKGALLQQHLQRAQASRASATKEA